MEFDKLDTELKRQRLNAYVTVRGGWPVPLAGATYWLVIATLGLFVSRENWSLIAAVLTGAIFPIALAYAELSGNRFMQVDMPDKVIMIVALLAMLLFWPAAVVAMWNFNDMFPLILAIGMSTHWPIVGWAYGRLTPFVAHVAIRTVAVVLVWFLLPEGRFTVLPFMVFAVYLLTTIWLYIDSVRFSKAKGGDG